MTTLLVALGTFGFSVGAQAQPTVVIRRPVIEVVAPRVDVRVRTRRVAPRRTVVRPVVVYQAPPPRVHVRHGHGHRRHHHHRHHNWHER